MKTIKALVKSYESYVEAFKANAPEKLYAELYECAEIFEEVSVCLSFL